ncbi:MAG: hypothetical protein QXW37_00150 [Candidatus Nitrosotenuis sp.]
MNDLWTCGSIVLVPKTCFSVRGFPSLKTVSQQYFIENSAIFIIIGDSAIPFSVMVYSTLGGVSE